MTEFFPNSHSKTFVTVSLSVVLPLLPVIAILIGLKRNQNSATFNKHFVIFLTKIILLFLHMINQK